MNGSKTDTGASSSLRIIRTAAELRAAVEPARADGTVVGLVPTMGALHDGHLSLVRRARRDCGLVVASLFVNPTQFGENEDFASYPRDETRDMELFEQNGVDIVYAPGVEEMYPDGFGITVTVSGLTEGLCGATRPGHFDGVTTVVSKLFDHCRPDAAYFGEKDYQQLKVVEQMVRDLDLSVRIVGIPVVRERDGLALSSRNAYLNVSERRIAPALQGTMRAVAGRLSVGVDLDAQCRWGEEALLGAGFDRVDYFEIRDSETLAPVDGYRPGLRIFAAAWLRDTRLIDNLAVDEIE
ncbi:MAG: pantoate--beta-alanine ligase [Alphaproteobacteria bacterium]